MPEVMDVLREEYHALKNTLSEEKRKDFTWHRFLLNTARRLCAQVYDSEYRDHMSGQERQAVIDFLNADP